MEERNREEAFFEESAQRFKTVFSNTTDEYHLLYLRHQFKAIKLLLEKLQQPWDRYIPLLYRSFALYMQHPCEFNSHRKAYRLSAELMDCITFLSQSGRLIQSMAEYYNRQAREIENKLAESNPSAGETAMTAPAGQSGANEPETSRPTAFPESPKPL